MSTCCLCELVFLTLDGGGLMFVKKNQSKSVLGENELDLRINSLNATKGK